MTADAPASKASVPVRILAERSVAEPNVVGARLTQSLADLRERDAAVGAFVALADPRQVAAVCVPPRGPLAGVLVGVKDIFDTRDLPTCYGSPDVYPPQAAAVDAVVVAALRRLGAVVAGKTTTTPFAFLDPTATRNPAAPGRTPGGSSAGSAAAVAAARRAARPSVPPPTAASWATSRRPAGCPRTG
jgi:Asp-tRNA(Asn)/Glu-tRNA(Gln) amidotransferase A subunit family amidase